jgi:YbbR domain-containing protein
MTAWLHDQAPVLADTFDVVITGPQSVVSSMNKQSMELVVDAKGLIAGTHQMAVNVVLDADFKDKISAGNILLSPGEITFTLVNTP